MPNIYLFDQAQGIYLGSRVAALDPLDQEPMVPAGATLLAPPPTGPSQTSIWDGQAWSTIVDYRGVEYWLPDGTRVEITLAGVEPPADAVFVEPQPSLEDEKLAAATQIDEAHAELLKKLTGNAMREEVDTWTIKAMAAQAVLDDTATTVQTDMIATEATGRGLTPQVFAQLVTDKSEAYQGMVGLAGNLRGIAWAAIDVATDTTQLADAVTTFQTQASAAIAAVQTQT